MLEPAARFPRYVASSRICCRHVSWLSCSAIDKEALARLLMAVSEATIEATSRGATTSRFRVATPLALAPWPVPSAGAVLMLVVVLRVVDLEAAVPEQAASTSARLVTAAATPSRRPEGQTRTLII